MTQLTSDDGLPIISPIAHPKISVVVLTCNRPDSLQLLMDALRRQTQAPAELIIVDTGASTQTSHILATSRLPGCLVDGSRMGISAARQLGLDNSSSPIIAMCDDDCVPDDHWLERLHQCFLVPTPPAVVAGAIEDRGSSTLPKGRGRLGRNGTYQLVRKIEEATHFGAANMALWRGTIMVLGGYDPFFNYGREEVDLVQRVRQAGHEVIYEPRARVVHRDVPSVRVTRGPWVRGAVANRLYFAVKHANSPTLTTVLSAVLFEIRLTCFDLRDAYHRWRHGEHMVALRTASTSIADRLLWPIWALAAVRARSKRYPEVADEKRGSV